MEEGYFIDRELEEAQRRFRLLETLDDPGTIAHLEAIGVAEGWHCLEAGAGGGSVAAWLSRRVGAGGRVLAIDLDVRSLAELDSGNLEVREHDLASDPLDEDAFDLVHTRSVLMHVSRREEALAKLARAVRPGGWILLEEPDAAFDAPDPSASPASRELYRRVIGAVYDFVRDRGADPEFGRELPGRLLALGFEELRCEGRLHLFRGGAEPRSAHMPALAEIRDLVVERGRVTAPDYDAFLALADDPAFLWRESLLMSVRGRKPGGR